MQGFFTMISNFFKRFFGKKPVPTPTPVPAPQPVPGPVVSPPYNAKVTGADENGLVELVNCPEWAGWKHQIKEVTDSLKGTQNAKAFANLVVANGRYNPDSMFAFIGACYPTVANGDQQVIPVGAVAFLDTSNWPSKTLPDGKTDGSTVDGIEAWCNSHAKPGPNPNATPFPHV